ncbi:hypothetical protein L7F22_047554 [Adiantum nelumboides]|nr:hypothetical protein [Adiantum nelumboides]
MVKLNYALFRMNDQMMDLKLSSLEELDMHYLRFCSLKQELEVLKDMVLDAQQEKLLFIATLPSHLDVEVSCTKLLGVKKIINFLKQCRCFQHVNQSFVSSWATQDDNSFIIDDDCSIDTKIDSNTYGVLISLDDANVQKDLCARSIEEKKSMEYVYKKECNTMVVLSVHTDACDMHVNMMADNFSPPSYELAWYPDDLWARGPIWDCKNDVNEVVGDASLSTLDSTSVVTHKLPLSPSVSRLSPTLFSRALHPPLLKMATAVEIPVSAIAAEPKLAAVPEAEKPGAIATEVKVPVIVEAEEKKEEANVEDTSAEKKEATTTEAVVPPAAAAVTPAAASTEKEVPEAEEAKAEATEVHADVAPATADDNEGGEEEKKAGELTEKPTSAETEAVAPAPAAAEETVGAAASTKEKDPAEA